MKILLVEDHESVVRVSLLILRAQFGHEAKAVGTGAEALAAAKDFMPDVIILDIGLPDMSGYDVAQQMRADDAFDAVVLVAVTGHDAREHEKQAREAGCDAIFSKPVDFSAALSVQRAAGA
jgi:CheY-like chemotaxis protein